MAKSLKDLGAGEGHVLPNPVVAPVTSPGQAVPASPTNVIDTNGVRMTLAEGTTSDLRPVEWVRASDGRMVAEIYGTLDPGGSAGGLQLSAYSPPEGGGTGLSMSANNPADGGSCILSTQQVSGQYYSYAAAYATGSVIGYVVTILDETGASDFGYRVVRYPALATVTANADTTLLTGSGYSVKGGFLGPDFNLNYGVLHCVMAGDYLNNTGATKTLTFKISYGGTTLWGDTSLAFGASANRRVWMLEFWLANENATNAQRLWGTLAVNRAAAPTTGAGGITGVADLPAAPIAGTATVDSTAAQTLNVTVAHSVAGGATLDIRRYGGAFIERL